MSNKTSSTRRTRNKRRVTYTKIKLVGAGGMSGGMKKRRIETEAANIVLKKNEDKVDQEEIGRKHWND